MPDRVPDDISYLHAHGACPACTQPVGEVERSVKGQCDASEVSRTATTIHFDCHCGYRIRWVCRCRECQGLPGAPDPYGLSLQEMDTVLDALHAWQDDRHSPAVTALIAKLQTWENTP